MGVEQGRLHPLLWHLAVSLETDGNKLQVKPHKLKVALPALVLHWQGSPPSISALENKQGDGLSSQVQQDPAGTSWYLQHILFWPSNVILQQHLDHAWPFLMVSASEVTLNFHQTLQGGAICTWASVNYHIHGRSDSLGSFAKGNESLFSNASSLWFLLYQIFQNPEASQVDLFRGGIVNGSGFALACFNFNCYFSCRGLCHSPHSLWMITAALSEAVPSPLCPSSF